MQLNWVARHSSLLRAMMREIDRLHSLAWEEVGTANAMLLISDRSYHLASGSQTHLASPLIRLLFGSFGSLDDGQLIHQSASTDADPGHGRDCSGALAPVYCSKPRCSRSHGWLMSLWRRL